MSCEPEIISPWSRQLYAVRGKKRERLLLTNRRVGSEKSSLYTVMATVRLLGTN